MFNLKEFKNPSVRYRSIPFWSLNGKLTKKELKRQILNMKKMGFGGAFLHSRTGLETEYLSDEWFDLMDYCKDNLIENGMEVYLYDEDRYPSGTCGGLVTKEKQFKEKSMNYFEVTDFASFKKPDDFIALFAVKHGKNGKCISYHEIQSFNETKSDEKVYCFYVYYMKDDPFYNGNCMLDAMNIDATNKFVELTHEQYKRRFGKLFGKEIKGIFTDEPCRGPMFTGFTHIAPNCENLVPYTYKLFDEFEKRMGYDLKSRLPEIWFGLENEKFVKTTYDYVEVLEQLFLENFAEPYSKWCKDNNLKFTGHILHEDHLAAQVNMSGSMMRFYEYFDYPGIDNLGPSNNFYNVPALASSVAKQLGKDYVLDELYGVSGWPMKLEDYKRIGDWQSAGGITLRVPHLCWYTMKGEAKRDCPASIFHQSAWYLEYKNVEDYFARLTFMLKEGKDSTDIAIINPIESCWGLANQYAYAGFECAKEETYVRLEKEYYDLYKDLIFNGFSVDYIDEGLFAKYGSVSNDSFNCGKMSYKTIILNGNLNLRSSTLSALKDFINKKGKVLVVGHMPEYLDGIRHNFDEDLKGSIFVDFDTKKVCSYLDKGIAYTSSDNVILVKRLYDDDLFLFALNKSENEENVSIRVKTNKNPMLLDLRTGEVKKTEFIKENEEIIINKTFAKNEELAIYFTDNSLNLNDEIKYNSSEVIFDNEFEYELKENNYLVLNKCSLYFNNELISKNYSVFADLDLRKKIGLDPRGNQMLQPWFREKFYPEINKKFGVCRLHYEFNCKNIPTQLKAMFELQKNERILINNKEVDFSTLKESEIDCCFSEVKIDTSLLKIGLNEVDIIFDYYFNSNVEDHYLIGNFGVSLNDKIDSIISLPSTIKAGSLNEQGFGFFGGKILLKKTIDNGLYEISTEKMGPACISINGKFMAFAPYKTIVEVTNNILEIELTFTRQNCFGIITVGNQLEGIKEQGFAPFKIKKIN